MEGHAYASIDRYWWLPSWQLCLMSLAVAVFLCWVARRSIRIEEARLAEEQRWQRTVADNIEWLKRECHNIRKAIERVDEGGSDDQE